MRWTRVCILALLAPVAARPAAMKVSWGELAGVIGDRNISTVLTDGTHLEGQVLAVRPDELVLDIRKTSDRKAFPKGQRGVPRASLSALKVIREESVYRIVGAAAAGSATGVLQFWSALERDDETLIKTMPLTVAAAAVGGYFVGKAAGRRATLILIEREAPSRF